MPQVGRKSLWFGAVTLGTIYGGFKFWFKFKSKLDDLEKYTYKKTAGHRLKIHSIALKRV